MDLKGKKVNFLGDSITEGVGTTGSEKIYLNLLKDRLGLAEARNYGISGTRFAKQTVSIDDGTFDQDFPSRVEKMDADADVIIVFGGTNDFGHGDAPFGCFADRTKDTFCGACHELMTKLIERYPGKVIIFMTPLHRLSESTPFGDIKPEPVATLEEYVNMIKKTAAYYGLPVIDLFSMSGLQPKVPVIQEKFVPDGLHPCDAGHVILADRIEGFLRAL